MRVVLQEGTTHRFCGGLFAEIEGDASGTRVPVRYYDFDSLRDMDIVGGRISQQQGVLCVDNVTFILNKIAI